MISMVMMLILMLIMMMIMMGTTAGASTWNPTCPWHRLSLKPYQIGSVLTMGCRLSSRHPPTHAPLSSPVPPGPVQSRLSLLRALVTGHVLYEQGVCDGLESKPHGCKRLPFSTRVYRGLEGWRGMARVSNRGMARINRGMARHINLKNKDKGIQKNKKHKK